jgi:hypothetical protein
MKPRLLHVLMMTTLVGALDESGFAQGSFENMNFDQAKIVHVDSDPFEVLASEALTEACQKTDWQVHAWCDA